MGLIILPILIVLVLIGRFLTIRLFPSFNSVHREMSFSKKALVMLIGFVLFLPMFALCIYLLDANFPSGATGFASDMSMWVFFMTPFFLGVFIALGRCLAIKVVTYNQ